VHLGGIVGDSKSDDVIVDEDTVLSGYIDDTARADGYGLLPNRAAKPLVQLYRKHSR
jgi:hypothetical protein